MKRKLTGLLLCLALSFTLVLGGCSDAQQLARETVVKASEAARVEENYKTISGTVDVTVTIPTTDTSVSVSQTNVEILTTKEGGVENTDVLVYNQSDDSKSLDITYLRNGKTYGWKKEYTADTDAFEGVTRQTLVAERNAETNPTLTPGGESDTAQFTAIYERLMEIYEANKKDFGAVSDNVLKGFSDLIGVEAKKEADGFTVTVDVKKGFNNLFDTLSDMVAYAEKNPNATVESALKDKNGPVKKLLDSFVGDLKAKQFETVYNALIDMDFGFSELPVKAKEGESLYDYVLRVLTADDSAYAVVGKAKFTDVLLGFLSCDDIKQAKTQIDENRKDINEVFPKNAKIEVKLDKKYVVKSMSVDFTMQIASLGIDVKANFAFNGKVNLADISSAKA